MSVINVDKEYIMHDKDGIAYIDSLMKTGQDIDLGSCAITEEIAARLDNYVWNKHNVYSNDIFHSEAMVMQVIAPPPNFYISRNKSILNSIPKECNIEFNAEDLKKYPSLLFMMAEFVFLKNRNGVTTIDDSLLHLMLKTLRDIFPDDTYDMTGLSYIHTGDNSCYISSAQLNEIFKKLNTNNLQPKDFMKQFSIYPVWNIGNLRKDESDDKVLLLMAKLIKYINLEFESTKENSYKVSELMGV